MKKKLFFLLVLSLQFCYAQITFAPYQNYNYEPYTATISGNGTIFYTTDGSTPNVTSPSGQYQVSVQITQNTLIKARLRTGNVWSEVFSENFYVGPMPPHKAFFKPPAAWGVPCSYMNYIVPRVFIDFFPPGGPMQAACEGWFVEDYNFYEAVISFNNCAMIPSLLQERTINTTGTVFYDYSSGVITNPPACLLAVDDTKSKTTVVKVLQNPVQDVLRIDSEIDFSAFELLDASGRIIKAAKLTSKSVNVSELVPGTYFLKLQSPQQQIYFLKFIKK